MNWSDPAVQAAIIQAIAAIFVGIAAAVIGKELVKRKTLQQKLLLAQKDIAFLLAVEEAHCDLHIHTTGESFKIRIREIARKRNYTWSGKFTPGRANDSPTMQRARLACAQA